MNRLQKTTFSLILFLMASLPGFASGDTPSDSLKVPESAVILSQTSASNGLIYSMIDLDTNELVLIYYGYFHDAKYFRLRKVIRTGIILDPEKQERFLNYDSKPCKEGD